MAPKISSPPVSPLRKALFLLSLGVIGMLGAGVIGAFLLYKDIVQYEWSENLRRDLRRIVEGRKPRRILVLGDSFLAAWPIEHCLHSDLERWAGDHEIGLINTAVGGYGPYEYFDQMERHAPNFGPGLVLLFYYVGNDLSDVEDRAGPLRSHLFSPSDGEPHRRPFMSSATVLSAGFLPVRPILLAQQPTLRQPDDPAPGEPSFNWKRFEARGIAPDLIEKARNRLRHPNAIGPDYVNPYLLEGALRNPNYLIDNLIMESKQALANWETVKEKLRGVASLAREVEAELCLIAIPSTAQVDRSHWEFYRKATLKLDERLADAASPQELMGEFCREERIDFIDLLPRFRAYPRTEELYWENDEHLAEPGHRLAFKALLDGCLEAWRKKTARKAD
jgi:hypothetical protein